MSGFKKSVLVVRPPFSLIGYAADDPLNDRVESLLIKRVSAVDAQLGNEIAGTTWDTHASSQPGTRGQPGHNRHNPGHAGENDLGHAGVVTKNSRSAKNSRLVGRLFPKTL
jgi:hypothetical protein